jgi:HD-GYP domain-containing protein (c-di-GMP phosphodiesterase class II)
VLADLFMTHGQSWFDRLATVDPWDAVLALEPEPHRMFDGDALDDALTVAADFIDLKSPYMGGHSRRCAHLSADAARWLQLSPDAVSTLRRGCARARLRHHRRVELHLGQT